MKNLSRYIIFLYLFSSALFASEIDCSKILIPKKNFAKIVHSKNSRLHMSTEVMAEQNRIKRHGAKVSQDPTIKIVNFLDALEHIHNKAALNESVKERLRRHYYSKYIIKPEDIPESYFKHQQLVARQQGHGNVMITDQMRAEAIGNLIADQKQSLDSWFDYFLSSDADSYPFYGKYWSFNEMLKLSKFNLDTGKFATRSKNTVAPFPELNREALAKVVDQLSGKLQKGVPQETNFGKIYGRELKELHEHALKIAESLKSVDGKWVKYDKGSDHMPLVNSLTGKNTGWCTAGAETARSQLSKGDFHVFYSLDEMGRPTIPRVAIRNEGNAIAEVRGVGKDQNLDSFIAKTDVVKNKLKEFGSEGQKYQKKDADMKLLTRIEEQHTKGDKLSREELNFLYEVDNKIEGFGHERDPRIVEIISSRNAKEDLAYVLRIKESEISLTEIEALSGGIKFHSGNLNLYHLKNAEGIKFPENVGGNLTLSGLQSAGGLKLPKKIGGTLSLGKLESAQDLKFPKKIGGDLVLTKLLDAEGLKFPEVIGGSLHLPYLYSVKNLDLQVDLGGSLYLESLTRAKGLKLPGKIGGDLNLRSLRSADGLSIPSEIGGSLNLNGLESIKGLILPEKIGKNLHLNGLLNADGLKFPDVIGGSLNLEILQRTDGLKLPRKIRGNLDLSNLKSAEGLKFPDEVGGNIDLFGLPSAEGLNLPDKIGKSVLLNGLKSADSLKLPDKIGKCLVLSGLKSARGLKLPNEIGGSLDFYNLQSARGLKLPNEIGGSLSFYSLQSADGLIFSGSIRENIHLNGLLSADNLRLPDKIGGNLNLDGLQSAQGLKLPLEIGRDLSLNGLQSAQGLKLPLEIGRDLSLNGLQSGDNLKLPNIIRGNLNLNGLKSADGLKLPNIIGQNLYLNGLQSAVGLEFPEKIGNHIYLISLQSANGLKLPLEIGQYVIFGYLKKADGIVTPLGFDRSKLSFRNYSWISY